MLKEVLLFIININSLVFKKPWIKEEHLITLKEAAFSYVKFPNFNVQQKAVMLLAKILRYTTPVQKQEILSFTGKIQLSTNFYERKLYIFFFDEALENFSINYLKDNEILENYLKFLDDNMITKNICIRSLKNFYFLLDDFNDIKENIHKKVLLISEDQKLDKETDKAVRDFKQWFIFCENNKTKFLNQIDFDLQKLEEEKNLKKELEKTEEAKEKKKSSGSSGKSINFDDKIKYRKSVV